jgi:hypothetical protein
MGAVGHFITQDEDLPGIVGQIYDMIAPGSYLVLTHDTVDHLDPKAAESEISVFETASAPFVPRTREQVTDLFKNFELIDPGLTDIRHWYPYPCCVPTTFTPGRTLCYGGVGVKPQSCRRSLRAV